MIGLEVNDVAIVEQKEILEQALSTNPKTQKALQKLIRKVIMEARTETMSAIHFQNGDPHKSVRSIRTSVYKKILGANINIYNSKKAHGKVSYAPSLMQRPMHARGGNRMKRGPLTQRMLSYGPFDRGMILRCVNAGTQVRYALSGRMSKRGFNASNGAKRGSIEPRNFFRQAGEPTLVRAADALANLIDEELYKMLNQKK